MEKNPGRLEDDPSSLTSFNFIAEGDEEGLISKIFSKFKTAVSSNSNQQYTSPSSSTRTISIVLSNESGVITDHVVPEQHLAELTKTPSNTSSSATDTIVPVAATSYHNTASTNTTTTATHHATNKTDSNTSMASSPLPIHTQKSNTSSVSANANVSSNNASTSTPSQEDTRLKKTASNGDASANTMVKTTPASLPKQHKHIIIDEEQNQQQQIPSHMIIPLTKTTSIDSDTQSVMTTFSVSNTNSLSRILNRLRGGEPMDSNKDFWMPDEQCKECNNCNAPFNLFRRKHHCRTCGKDIYIYKRALH